MGNLTKEQRELAEQHFANRQKSFLDDYTELVKKHKLEFQGYIAYTPGGITPQWRIEEHVEETPASENDPTPEQLEKADEIQAEKEEGEHIPDGDEDSTEPAPTKEDLPNQTE